MRAGILVTGVLGLGTVLVFVAAAVTATLFPNGTLVNAGWNGNIWARDGWEKGGIVVPLPEPVLEGDPGVIVEDDFMPLPGDTVNEGKDLPIVVRPAP